MSEKRKSTSHYAVQEKNRQKTIGTEETLGVIRGLEKRVNERVAYAIMLDWFIAAYVQLLMTLMELEKVLSQGRKCFCSKTTTVLSE